jgi:hypothetical protein
MDSCSQNPLGCRYFGSVKLSSVYCSTEDFGLKLTTIQGMSKKWKQEVATKIGDNENI